MNHGTNMEKTKGKLGYFGRDDRPDKVDTESDVFAEYQFPVNEPADDQAVEDGDASLNEATSALQDALHAISALSADVEAFAEQMQEPKNSETIDEEHVLAKVVVARENDADEADSSGVQATYVAPNQTQHKADGKAYYASVAGTNSGFEANNDKEYTIYKIDIETGVKNWVVYRRFNGFRDLHLILKKQKLVDSKFGDFPKKSIIGRFNEKTIDSRLHYFTEFIRSICENPELAYHPAVLEFLQINQQVLVPATRHGDTDALLPFLKNPELNVNSIYTDDGRPLIHVAVLSGNPDMVALLCQHGADLSVKFRDWTALHVAVVQEHAPEIVNELLIWRTSRKLDVNAQEGSGNTALLLAVARGIKTLPVVRLLVKAQANPCVTNALGDSPLHHAVRNRDFEVVQYLCKECGSQVLHLQNKDGDTLLHLACMAGDVQTMKLLIDLGANCDASNFRGDTPLSVICVQDVLSEEKTMAVARSLIEKGASPDGGFLVEKTITQKPSRKLKLDIRRASVNKNNPNSKPPTAQPRRGTSPLFAAAYTRRLRLAKMLVNLGADINCRHGSSGRTQLHGLCAIAAQDKSDVYDLPAVLFVELGAFITIKDMDGLTPLDLAPPRMQLLLTEAAARSPLSRIIMKAAKPEPDSTTPATPVSSPPASPPNSPARQTRSLPSGKSDAVAADKMELSLSDDSDRSAGISPSQALKTSSSTTFKTPPTPPPSVTSEGQRESIPPTPPPSVASGMSSPRLQSEVPQSPSDDSDGILQIARMESIPSLPPLSAVTSIGVDGFAKSRPPISSPVRPPHGRRLERSNTAPIHPSPLIETQSADAEDVVDAAAPNPEGDLMSRSIGTDAELRVDRAPSLAADSRRSSQLFTELDDNELYTRSGVEPGMGLDGQKHPKLYD